MLFLFCFQKFLSCYVFVFCCEFVVVNLSGVIKKSIFVILIRCKEVLIKV